MAGGNEHVPVFFAGVAQKDFGEDIGDVEAKVKPDDEVSAPIHQIPFRYRSEDFQVLKED